MNYVDFKNARCNDKNYVYVLQYIIFIPLPFLPLGATALGEQWPPQQSVSTSLYLASSPSTALSSLLSGLLPH